MHEVIEEPELNCLKDGIACKKISMYYKRDATEDPRGYNKSKIGEIAVISDGENGQPIVSDFMVHSKTETTEFTNITLNILSQNCDPIVYPLLFLHGEPGCHT
jgi:hypothetical protein